jgi:hypothetical protein
MSTQTGRRHARFRISLLVPFSLTNIYLGELGASRRQYIYHAYGRDFD